MFFTSALATGSVPVEVTTDKAPTYPRLFDELIPAALPITEQYANNFVEADHGRLKARLRPMRGLHTFRSARTLTAGHAFIQNLSVATTSSLPMHPHNTDYGQPLISWYR